MNLTPGDGSKWRLYKFAITSWSTTIRLIIIILAVAAPATAIALVEILR